MVLVVEAYGRRVVVVGIVGILVLLAEVGNFVEDTEDVRNVDLPEVDVECILVVVHQELVAHTFALSQVHIRVVAVDLAVALVPEVGRMRVGIRLKQDLGIAAVGIVEDSEIVAEIVAVVDEKIDAKVVDAMIDEEVDAEYEEADEAIDAKTDDLDESLDEVIDELGIQKVWEQQEHNFHLAT